MLRKKSLTMTHKGGKIIITNAYQKHSRQMTKQDKEKVKITIKYKKDYLKRIKEGTYYAEE